MPRKQDDGFLLRVVSPGLPCPFSVASVAPVGDSCMGTAAASAGRACGRRQPPLLRRTDGNSLVGRRRNPLLGCMDGGGIPFSISTGAEPARAFPCHTCPVRREESYSRIYKAELEKDGKPDVDGRLQEGFQTWFKEHIFRKHKENPKEVDAGLFALACGPDFRVRTYSACVVDGVRFLTADREKGKKTQNSGVMSKLFGTDIDLYGVLKEIKVLSFNSDMENQRSVVLFNFNRFRLGGLKAKLEDYDKLYRSMNITNFWYKDDKYILATQATKVFYVPDTKLGKNWRVIQKFQHRHIFDVCEIGDNVTSDVAYQEAQGSDNEDNDVSEDTVSCLERPPCDDRHIRTIDGTVVNRIKKKRKAAEDADESEPEVDDTIEEYCSEKEDERHQVDDSDAD